MLREAVYNENSSLFGIVTLIEKKRDRVCFLLQRRCCAFAFHRQSRTRELHDGPPYIEVHEVRFGLFT